MVYDTPSCIHSHNYKDCRWHWTISIPLKNLIDWWLTLSVLLHMWRRQWTQLILWECKLKVTHANCSLIRKRVIFTLFNSISQALLLSPNNFFSLHFMVLCELNERIPKKKTPNNLFGTRNICSVASKSEMRIKIRISEFCSWEINFWCFIFIFIFTDSYNDINIIMNELIFIFMCRCVREATGFNVDMRIGIHTGSYS